MRGCAREADEFGDELLVETFGCRVAQGLGLCLGLDEPPGLEVGAGDGWRGVVAVVADPSVVELALRRAWTEVLRAGVEGAWTRQEGYAWPGLAPTPTERRLVREREEVELYRRLAGEWAAAGGPVAHRHAADAERFAARLAGLDGALARLRAERLEAGSRTCFVDGGWDELVTAGAGPEAQERWAMLEMEASVDGPVVEVRSWLSLRTLTPGRLRLGPVCLRVSA